jgi:tetratricopeptide (TPR) repeat protein
MFSTAFLLSCPVAVLLAVSSGVVGEADSLYWNRNQNGNLERSIALLESQPGNQPENLWRLGRSLVRLGEKKVSKHEKIEIFSRAESLLRQAVTLEPQSPQAHCWLGIAMGRRGEARGILRSLFLIGPLKREMREVLKLDPKHAWAHHVLGEMLFQIPIFAGGSKKGAVRELEMSASSEPDGASHFTALAKAYLAVGKRDQARTALEHVFTIKTPADPAEYDEDVRDAREMLKNL